MIALLTTCLFFVILVRARKLCLANLSNCRGRLIQLVFFSGKYRKTKNFSVSFLAKFELSFSRFHNHLLTKGSSFQETRKFKYFILFYYDATFTALGEENAQNI